MPASDSSMPRVLASDFAAIPIGFSINAFVHPSLMVVYGVRDVFIGVVLFSALFSCHPKTVDWIMIETSAVAYVDGFVCWTHGRRGWNRLRYAPVLTVIVTLFGSV
ncbi:hypothetical protein BDV24DRAFT_158545 [Aspergillus arachidicola]|uniref:Uncharacterized protein n=1 Tax=Aspergillus arachidicola TaxID=656916 RepID=A0A2G7FFN0_9EURO|nr:hypothetical protein BDV24DRAFT_158545 [Aspergillus arachidicola]PIG79427.1 hypothetical protein AARAC_010752 [Aspergillus arachidicola]